MSFANIPGNARIKKILQAALLRETLPNSLLFIGPEGVGKMQTALEVAKALNCREMKDDACGDCEPCRTIAAGLFPDVMILRQDKNMIKIDPIRDLKQAAYLKPMTGGKRVFIIEEAEKMNVEAANTLLKVLEEPPAFSFLLLVTSNPYLILPTIKSRCQILKFAPIGKDDILGVLKARGYPEEQAEGMALIAQGNLKRALNMDWDEVREKREKAWMLLLSMVARKDITSLLKSYAYRRRSEFVEEFQQILEMLAAFSRDIMLVKEGGDIHHLLNPDYAEKISEAGTYLSVENAREIPGRVDQALHALKNHVNTGLLVSSLSISLMGESHV